MNIRKFIDLIAIPATAAGDMDKLEKLVVPIAQSLGFEWEGHKTNFKAGIDLPYVHFNTTNNEDEAVLMLVKAARVAAKSAPEFVRMEYRVYLIDADEPVPFEQLDMPDVRVLPSPELLAISRTYQLSTDQE